jgi:hypothetical protein
MLQFALWPILAIIMGLAFVTLFTIVGIISWSTAHLMRDVAIGDDGKIWCPVHKQFMTVHGVPRGSITAPFAGLDRCQEYGDGRIQCRKTCLVQINQASRQAA